MRLSALLETLQSILATRRDASHRHIIVVTAILGTLALCACGKHSPAAARWRAEAWKHGREVAWTFRSRDADRPYHTPAPHAHDPLHPLRNARPNPSLTPGALNPAVTQANIHETICVPGYSRSIRPPEDYTERLKRLQIREYGYRDRWLRDYEEDHLIALSLGGSPTSPENLWPQPHDVVGGWGSYAKDRLEGRLHWLVCHRGLRLATAQRALARDWIAAYQRYIGRVPNNQRLHWNGG